MIQKKLDLPWHTSSLKDISLQLISWNLRASRRKVLWDTSFLWEGIIQAKSLLTDIFTLEFFQLSIHPDCFLSSEEKCLWKVMHFYPLLSDSLNFMGVFFWKKGGKSTLFLMSLLLTSKFSVCLQNRWKATMPAGQTSLSTQCVFFPSLKPGERVSWIPDAEMDVLAPQAFPHCLSSVGNCAHTIAHTWESPLSNISSRRSSNHQGWLWLWATPSARKVVSGSNFCSPPLMLLICRKFRAGSEMSWAPCVLIHLLPTWKEVDVLGMFLLCLWTALQGFCVKAGEEHLLWFNSSAAQPYTDTCCLEWDRDRIRGIKVKKLMG